MFPGPGLFPGHRIRRNQAADYNPLIINNQTAHEAHAGLGAPLDRRRVPRSTPPSNAYASTANSEEALTHGPSSSAWNEMTTIRYTASARAAFEN